MLEWYLQIIGSDTNPALKGKEELRKESLRLPLGCTLGFTRRCHCRLKSGRHTREGGLSAKREGDSTMVV